MKLFVEGLSSDNEKCVLMDLDLVRKIFSDKLIAVFEAILRVDPQDKTGEYFVVAKATDRNIFFTYIAEKIDPYLFECLIEINDREHGVRCCDRDTLITGLNVISDVDVSDVSVNFQEFARFLSEEIFEFWSKEEASAREKKNGVLSSDFISIEE